MWAIYTIILEDAIYLFSLVIVKDKLVYFMSSSFPTIPKFTPVEVWMENVTHNETIFCQSLQQCFARWQFIWLDKSNYINCIFHFKYELIGYRQFVYTTLQHKVVSAHIYPDNDSIFASSCTSSDTSETFKLTTLCSFNKSTLLIFLYSIFCNNNSHINVNFHFKGVYPDKYMQLLHREFPECGNMCIKVKIPNLVPGLGLGWTYSMNFHIRLALSQFANLCNNILIIFCINMYTI